jgi:hypothetical protein
VKRRLKSEGITPSQESKKKPILSPGVEAQEVERIIRSLEKIESGSRKPMQQETEIRQEPQEIVIQETEPSR